jgi:hypothetical protein
MAIAAGRTPGVRSAPRQRAWLAFDVEARGASSAAVASDEPASEG